MILVDTTPLVAVCDPADSRNQTAGKEFASLASNEFAVCDAVLSEACFHLRLPEQRDRLRRVLARMKAQPIPAANDLEFQNEVFDWLAKYADQRPDWADACLAVLSGRDPGVTVWTYDREFYTTWRRPNGTAIPLAVRLK